MKLTIAECSAVYSGRGDSTLARGLRAILIKSDGSVSIHNDNSNKPLNYMKTASQTVSRNSEGEEVWSFDARHETLSITIHQLYSSFEEQLLDKTTEPGLKADGTEAQLQQWLFENLESWAMASSLSSGSSKRVLALWIFSPWAPMGRPLPLRSKERRRRGLLIRCGATWRT